MVLWPAVTFRPFAVFWLIEAANCLAAASLTVGFRSTSSARTTIGSSPLDARATSCRRTPLGSMVRPTVPLTRASPWSLLTIRGSVGFSADAPRTLWRPCSSWDSLTSKCSGASRCDANDPSHVTGRFTSDSPVSRSRALLMVSFSSSFRPSWPAGTS